jgi:hypothetical protein
MSDPLAGCTAKVERAKLHLRSLGDELRPFLDSEPKPYRFFSKVDVESSRYLLRIWILRPLPVEWSLIVGDFVQNLRAALDHLIYQLVRANGQPPTRGNAFPIFDQPPPRKRGHPERERWSAMLKGVHPGVMGLIEFAQPYGGPHGPSRHLLAALRRLSNEDKHRVLLSSYTAIGTPKEPLEIDVIGVRDVRPLQGGRLYTGYALKNGDLVLEAPVEVTGPNPEVKLKTELPLNVGFGWKPVPLEALLQMGKSVEEIIALARSFVDPLT